MHKPPLRVRAVGDVLQPAPGFRASAIEKFSVNSIQVVDEGVVAFFGSYQWCLFAFTTYLLPEPPQVFFLGVCLIFHYVLLVVGVPIFCFDLDWCAVV